jgi:hypothetical protein
VRHTNLRCFVGWHYWHVLDLSDYGVIYGHVVTYQRCGLVMPRTAHISRQVPTEETPLNDDYAGCANFLNTTGPAGCWHPKGTVCLCICHLVKC